MSGPLRPHGGNLAGLAVETSEAPLPGCNPPWWRAEAAVRASHAACESPTEALALERGERLALLCPCPCHHGGEVPMPYRPARGPNAEAGRPPRASRRVIPW